MRDIKIVAYGSVDDVDEANIRTALEESGVSKITIYTVDPLYEIKKEKDALITTNLRLHDDVAALEIELEALRNG